MYDAYPYLYMQLSKKAEYISAPDWFYNVEYAKEKDRGYDCLEDLFVPGFFEFEIKKGESVYLSLSLSEEATEKLKTDFAAEIKKRTPRTNFENCLINSANQFFVRKPTGTELIAGYPWFSKRLRNTLAALPGLTLQSNNKTDFKKTLDTITADLKAYYTEGQPLKFQDACFADSKLWYAFTLQHYLHFSSEEEVYKKYLPVLKLILNKFKTNSCPNIHMAENGLIHADSTGHPLTWMDTISNNMPVTKRPGYVVEVNALWYNAIAFAVNLSEKFGDTKFVSTWKPIEEQVKNSFIEVFTDENHKGLADFVYQNHKDFTIRPNQIIAASLEFSPLNIYQCNDLLEEVKQNLLTDKGLRTLPPNHLNYHGNCAGSASDKEQAYHQGTAWPWLSGHFAAAYLKIHGKGGLSFVRTMYAKFEEEMKLHGIGTISEMFDADPPHKGRGAISYAWSVAEILRIKFLADNLEKQ
ncbi:MAG TPA: amylo-alpha-1,6-glucosidase [Bacteroidales bacterium]|nr:amylo-alpha-1,6-glucosidase [Bacteroidales bacterium]